MDRGYLDWENDILGRQVRKDLWSEQEHDANGTEFIDQMTQKMEPSRRSCSAQICDSTVVQLAAEEGGELDGCMVMLSFFLLPPLTYMQRL